MIVSSTRALVVAATAILGTAVFLPAGAQSAPAPTPTASPTAAPTPNVIGQPASDGDPCTSLSAIVTRPSVTTSVCTVRPQKILIETGYQNTSYNGSGQVVDYPQSYIRVGVARNLELAFAPPQEQVQSIDGLRQTGTTDATIGLKAVIGYTPKTSYGAFVQASVPTGDRTYTSYGSNLILGLNGTLTLSPAFSLFGTIQGQDDTTGTARYGSIVPSLGVSATLPTSFPASAFVEDAQFTKATGPGSSTRTQLLGGITFDVGSRVQLDAEYGYSPTIATGRYHYVGFGVSTYLY